MWTISAGTFAAPFSPFVTICHVLCPGWWSEDQLEGRLVLSGRWGTDGQGRESLEGQRVVEESEPKDQPAHSRCQDSGQPLGNVPRPQSLSLSSVSSLGSGHMLLLVICWAMSDRGMVKGLRKRLGLLIPTWACG